MLLRPALDSRMLRVATVLRAPMTLAECGLTVVLDFTERMERLEEEACDGRRSRRRVAELPGLMGLFFTRSPLEVRRIERRAAAWQSRDRVLCGVEPLRWAATADCGRTTLDLAFMERRADGCTPSVLEPLREAVSSRDGVFLKDLVLEVPDS